MTMNPREERSPPRREEHLPEDMTRLLRVCGSDGFDAGLRELWRLVDDYADDARPEAVGALVGTFLEGARATSGWERWRASEWETWVRALEEHTEERANLRDRSREAIAADGEAVYQDALAAWEEANALAERKGEKPCPEEYLPACLVSKFDEIRALAYESLLRAYIRSEKKIPSQENRGGIDGLRRSCWKRLKDMAPVDRRGWYSAAFCTAFALPPLHVPWGQGKSQQVFEEVLGVGRNGVAYASRPVGSDLRKVTKVFVGELARENYKRELRQYKRLSGVNGVVSLHDHGEEPQPFLVLDYRPNSKTLADKLAGALPLVPKLAARIVLQLAEIVGEVHDRGVLHGDLKHANVLVDDHEQVRVTDLGAAASLSADGKTEEPAWQHTPGYAAPEQVYGQRLTPAADVYSLTAMLHEMVIGSVPDARDPQKELGWLRRSSRVGSWMAAILAKGLQKDPRDRYATAHALAADLRLYLNGQRPRACWLRRWVDDWGKATAVPLALGSLLCLGAYSYKANRDQWERQESQIALLNQLLEDQRKKVATTFIGEPGPRKRKDWEEALTLWHENKPLTPKQRVDLLGGEIHEFSTQTPNDRKEEHLKAITLLYELLAGEDNDHQNGALLRVGMGNLHDFYARTFPERSPEWLKQKVRVRGFYLEAIAIDPNCAAGWNNLADVRLEIGQSGLAVLDAKQALAVTRQALAQDPNSVPVCVLADRQFTLFQALILHNQRKGEWNDADWDAARSLAAELIKNFTESKQRGRAEGVEKRVLPSLEKKQPISPGLLKVLCIDLVSHPKSPRS